MKKRVIAIVCALATIFCVCAAVLTVDVSATAQNFEVGYDRVDINPWEDPYDEDGDGSKGKLMALPLSGNGASTEMNRQCVDTLLDDNGDGKIGEGDGLFASCMAVTDKDGDTVLLYSVAVVGADKEKLVNETRKRLIAELKTAGIEGIDLPAENIQIQATHTHSSISLRQYKETYKDSGKTYVLQDQDGDDTTDTIVAGEVYKHYEKWYPYFINQLVKAGVTAIKDRAPATMSKGQIDAGDTAPKTTAGDKITDEKTLTMNGVRHYTRVSTKTYPNELYVHGSNFNGNNMSAKVKGDGSTTVDSTGSAELVKANDTMYCLKFEFAAGSGKAPIALVNWRAHTTMVDRNGTKLYVSSDYINRMSYELSKESYRTIFIQGAAGNVTTGSHVYNWCGGNANAGKDGIFTGNELPSNVYGEVLGQVAAQCLENNMKAVDAGDIRVTNIVFNADAKSYKDNELAIRAAKTAKTAGVTEYPFVYPIGVSQNCYNNMSAEQQGWYKEYAKSEGWVENLSKTYKGKTYALASKFHRDDIVANADEVGRYDLDLTAFMLGDHVAFVTAPGELFDRYNRNLTWANLKGKNQLSIYNTLATSYNEWDKVMSKNVGGSYGTPFVMGYANGSDGYFPNSLAYEYCKDSKIAAVGSYESHVTELAQGQGEKILDTYADMLQYLATDEGIDNELYREAKCEACGKNVIWENVSNQYNNSQENPTLSEGHYFLNEENTTLMREIVIPADNTVCLDLRGNNITANTSRAFDVDGTFHLFDTIGDGVVMGHGGTGSSYGGGTVKVNEGGKFYLHSGNLTQGVSDKYKASSGGVIQTSGEFYMSGGTVYGGCASTNYGGNLYVRGEGSAVISGGSVYGGSAGKAGDCVYVYAGTSLTLSGDADVEEICFGSSLPKYFTISGEYTGTTTLKLAKAVDKTVGTAIGISDGAKLGGADISVEGSDLIVKVSGNSLVLAEIGGAQFEDADGNKVEKSLQTAIDACQGTDKVVTLTQDTEVTGITVTKELILDLNGKQVTGQINVSGDGKLICMDSQTADYKADDGIFTKLPANMAQYAEAAPGYVKYTHNDQGGKVSFHKIDTSVDYINLRAASAGLYYSSLFMGDTYAAEMVKTFGVALSIQGVPVSESGIADHALYSIFDGSLFEPGNLKEYTSTILVDILSEDYGPIQNRKNGNTMVYGRSYIQLTDGSYVVSAQRQMNLRTVIEYVNANWIKYNAATRKTVLELYERFPKVLGAWDTDAIEEEYNKSK